MSALNFKLLALTVAVLALARAEPSCCDYPLLGILGTLLGRCP